MWAFWPSASSRHPCLWHTPCKFLMSKFIVHQKAILLWRHCFAFFLPEVTWTLSMQQKTNLFVGWEIIAKSLKICYQNQNCIPDGFRHQFPSSVLKHICYNIHSYQSKDTPANQTLTLAGLPYLNLLQDKDTNPWHAATILQSPQRPSCWWIPLLRMALQWEEKCLCAPCETPEKPSPRPEESMMSWNAS